MRRRVAEKRQVIPDPKYGDEVVARFINCIMCSGKKSIAEAIVYRTFDEVTSRYKGSDDFEGGDEGSRGGRSGKPNPLALFKKALDNVCPLVEVKSRRVGGATYQIPIEVAPNRQVALGMRWLKEAARKRSEKGMVLRLAAEVLDAVAGRGEAVKKREDTHRMAKANQAFAHYRWN